MSFADLFCRKVCYLVFTFAGNSDYIFLFFFFLFPFAKESKIKLPESDELVGEARKLSGSGR